jgi:solute carrier family 25 carnitine/acylcarnitine transporter 20/29
MTERLLDNNNTALLDAKTNEASAEEHRGAEIKTVHDLIAGGIAGSASIVVGHPFDTVKVRMQVGAPGAGLASVATSFGGVSSLFRGLGAPLSTAAVVNAIIFASYGASSRLWDAYNHNRHTESLHGVITSEGGILIEHSPKETHQQIGKNMICGSFAGLVQSLIICPMEHVKCRLQIQHGQGAADYIYKNSLDCTQQIVQSHGLRGLYRGMASTCWREGPGFGFYFVSYDLVRDKITQVARCDEHSFMASFLAGGFAGCFVWASTYPFDIIKTRIQTAPLDAPSLKIATVARSLIRKEGFLSLYRGLGVTLIRAFPVNAILFPIYGFVLRQL